MLGCCFAVKLISNSQPIYCRSSHSSRVSRALSVFKITLAAHCYWLFSQWCKLYFNEGKQIPSYQVQLSHACTMHKGILSVTSHFEAASRERATKDLSGYYLGDTNQCTQLLLSKCLVSQITDVLSNVFTQQRCRTLTFQNPKLLSCSLFANIF